jgi:hypothetical protein
MDFTGCISGSTSAVMIQNSSVSSLALFLGNGASSVGFQAIDTKRDCYNTLPINSAFVPTFGLAFLAACELIIQSAQSELADNDHASSCRSRCHARSDSERADAGLCTVV